MSESDQSATQLELLGTTIYCGRCRQFVIYGQDHDCTPPEKKR